MRDVQPSLAQLFALRGPDRVVRELPDGKPIDAKLADVATKVTGFVAPPAAGTDMLEHVEALLRSTVGTVLANAWNKRNEILKYGDVAKYPPGNKPSYVALVPHDVKWETKSQVKVTINETIEKTIPLVLEGKFHIDGAELSIRNTRIMSMRTGKSWFEGKITAGKVEVIKRKGDEYVFPGEIDFGDGLQIPPPKPKT